MSAAPGRTPPQIPRTPGQPPEQDVQRLQLDRLHSEEVTGHDPLSLSPEELAPRRAAASGCRTKAAGPKQRPDGGGSHADAQLAELSLNPKAAPPGVLPGHAQDESTHLQIDRWSPGPSRSPVGPLASYEFPVPAQQRLRRNEKRCPPVPGQDPAGGGKQDAVECGESGTASLATQYTELLPQYQDLQVLGTVSSAWQDQHAGKRADDQREQEQHRPMVRSPYSQCESGFRAPQADPVRPITVERARSGRRLRSERCSSRPRSGCPPWRCSCRTW